MNGEDAQQPEKKRIRRIRRRAPRRHSKRRRVTIALWMLVSNLILFAFVIYAVLSLTETTLGAPGWMTRQAEQSVNASVTGARISLGGMQFLIDPDGVPAVRLTNLAIFDARGSETARLNNVSVILSPLDLLKGQLRPAHVNLAGAQIVVRRQTSGEFDLSFGSEGVTTGSFATLLDSLDDTLAMPALSRMRDLEAGDLTIALEDARSGRLWQITDGHMRLNRTSDGALIRMNFDVFNGTEELAETDIAVRSRAADSAATVNVSFRNASAADIALQSPALSYLSVLDAQISGALRSDFGADGALRNLSARLDIGSGALRPADNTQPIRFDRAQASFGYDPDTRRLNFTQVSAEGETASIRSSGIAYLRDFEGDWPATLLGQFRLSNLRLNPKGVWPEPVEFTDGAADLRIRLNPFSVEFGQVSLTTGQERLVASGALSSTEAGWQGALDARVDQIGIGPLISLWPTTLATKTRTWMADNISAGQFNNVRLSVRQEPGEAPAYDLGYGFTGAAIRLVKGGFPILEGASGYGKIYDGRAAIKVEKGFMRAPDGKQMDLSGSVLTIPDIRQRPARAEVDLAVSGPVPALLSTLNSPPVRALRNSPLGPEFASGDAKIAAHLSYPMKKGLKPEELRFRATGTITDAASDSLLRDKVITAEHLSVFTDNDVIEVDGPFRIGKARGVAKWTKERGPDHIGQSRLDGTLSLDPAVIEEFRVGLPEGFLKGSNAATFSLAFAADTPPAFTLRSDLKGLRLSLPQIGWSKAADTGGTLALAGQFAGSPDITSLNFGAPGLTLADGRIAFTPESKFSQASFGQAQVGAWLSAPLVLTARGEGLAPAISVTGGTLDIRKLAGLGAAREGTGGGTMPIDVALDRVRITDAVALRDVQANLTAHNGISGQFRARVNGGAVVTGALEPVAEGTAIRMLGNNAGKVLSDAGVFTTASGGALELVLRPRSGDAIYRGDLKITNTNVKGTSVLAELLNSLSVLGLLDQLRGAGIVFSDVDGEFDIYKDRLTLNEFSAVGPSLGISLDGTYLFNDSSLDMQGVISPVYFLNAIGQLVSPRRGEGLFGFSFRLTGLANAPKVAVNPLSILTPGIFRDIFRSQETETGQ